MIDLPSLGLNIPQALDLAANLETIEAMICNAVTNEKTPLTFESRDFHCMTLRSTAAQLNHLANKLQDITPTTPQP